MSSTTVDNAYSACSTVICSLTVCWDADVPRTHKRSPEDVS